MARDGRLSSTAPERIAPTDDVVHGRAIMQADERIAELEAEVARLTEELEKTRELLADAERLADVDALAPVANRRAFVREVTRMISFSERYNGLPSSLLYVDINDMKVVNDRFGHAAGDAAIMQVARLVLSNVRTSDVVGRLGGDEFGVLLSQASRETAMEKANALMAVIARTPFVWEGQETPLGVSCGVHTIAPGEDAATAMKAADAAMFERKRASKVGRI